MSDDLSHLTPAAAELLQAPQDARIRAILCERWVQYSRAARVLRILDLLLDHPRTTRMPSIAVYGDSGMGKTMIMQRFRDQHPSLFDSEAGIERTRVLALQLAGKPGERRLYAQILRPWVCPRIPGRRWLNSSRSQFASCVRWTSKSCCSMRCTISSPAHTESSASF